MQRLRKAIICSAIVLGICLFYPKESFGQYYNPGYNGGTYINSMIRARMNARRMAARRAGNKAVAKKKVVRRKSVRRTRRVSSLENIMDFRRESNGLYPERSEIV